MAKPAPIDRLELAARLYVPWVGSCDPILKNEALSEREIREYASQALRLADLFLEVAGQEEPRRLQPAEP